MLLRGWCHHLNRRDPVGVELIVEAPDEETKKLRYPPPSSTDLDSIEWDRKLFNQSQLEFLVDNVPKNTDEWKKAADAFMMDDL